MKIKTGDTVIVISGDEKGKTGKVLKALPKDNKVVVEGINVKTKHVKPNQSETKGSKKEVVAPLDASKVALLNPETKEKIKVGYKTVDGKKVRVCKKCGTIIK